MISYNLKNKQSFCRFSAFLLCLFVLIPFLCTDTSAMLGDKISVSAKSAIIFDASKGGIGVLWEKNSHTRLPMASTTKIMTALVAIESMPISTVVDVPAAAVGVEGSSVYLFEGERQTLEALLYALLLESANDAATAIAIAVAGSVDEFAVLMNQRAESLNLADTHFVNPHGLDSPEHYTSAYDLALITAEALKNPIFCKIVGTYRTSMPIGDSSGSRLLINHNRLLRSYSGAIGGKTGFTKKSGRCLVSAAEREGLRLIAVTLSDPDDWSDHAKLLDIGFTKYENIMLAKAGEMKYAISVCGGEQSIIRAANSSDIRITLPRERSELKITANTVDFVDAPVKRGDVLGEIQWTFSANGSDSPKNVIASCPIVSEYNAAKAKNTKKSLWQIILSFLGFDKNPDS